MSATPCRLTAHGRIASPPSRAARAPSGRASPEWTPDSSTATAWKRADDDAVLLRHEVADLRLREILEDLRRSSSLGPRPGSRERRRATAPGGPAGAGPARRVRRRRAPRQGGRPPARERPAPRGSRMRCCWPKLEARPRADELGVARRDQRVVPCARPRPSGRRGAHRDRARPQVPRPRAPPARPRRLRPRPDRPRRAEQEADGPAVAECDGARRALDAEQRLDLCRGGGRSS